MDNSIHNREVIETQVQGLLEQMTLKEKIGQLILTYLPGRINEHFESAVAGGAIGAILNEVDVQTINRLQQIAAESRLKIPLLFGRDVIHGFKTVFPIPLAQAATWNPALVEQGARVSAVEAASHGVNWTFAPMLDISRDPRWGRIAESFGEDPYMTSVMGAAMIKGFQGESLADAGSIAACAKHFAGYGASESGRDYNTTNIPETELRNMYLPPFKAAVDAGAASVMTSFSDINGVPATANEFLLKQVLRDEWNFDGFVVSDWESVRQLTTHGLTEDDKQAALAAAAAGLDMEMASNVFAQHLESLVQEGSLPEERITAMAANILRIKFRLGLFTNAGTDPGKFPAPGNAAHLEAAKNAAAESIVLLKNKHNLLPLAPETVSSLAVIGPLADDAYEQLGTWIFDGDPNLSRTPLQALREIYPHTRITCARGMDTTRSKSEELFGEAVAAAEQSDAVLMFLGEESILSGEAHCRADITLPGNQRALIEAVAAAGKPVILVIMAGRPLALEEVIDLPDAILYAWHPGTMGGPAIAELIAGITSPSGKLPVTFPRVTGQIPIYYNNKRTGKPVTPETYNHIDSIPARSPQISVGNTSFHLDVHYTPLFHFGFGLSYTSFEYSNLQVSKESFSADETLYVSADVRNLGSRTAYETVQLYIHDIAGSITRPVKELKGFQKIRLEPGECKTVTFEITSGTLTFYNREHKPVAEPGTFEVWIGSSSEAELHGMFRLTTGSTAQHPEHMQHLHTMEA